MPNPMAVGVSWGKAFKLRELRLTCILERKREREREREKERERKRERGRERKGGRARQQEERRIRTRRLPFSIYVLHVDEQFRWTIWQFLDELSGQRLVDLLRLHAVDVGQLELNRGSVWGNEQHYDMSESKERMNEEVASSLTFRQRSR